MIKNSLGREFPDTLFGRPLRPYRDPFSFIPEGRQAARPIRRVNPGGNKLLGSLREAIEASGLRDGMTIGTHHHLRNGDQVLNTVVAEIAAMGIRDITIAGSSVHPVHEVLIPYIRDGVITRIECGVNGAISRMVSTGELDLPIITRSHGGRVRAMMCGDIKVDVAFIGAPTCDAYGNICASRGPSACGVVGYGHSDADFADCVIAVTDNLVAYPAQPISIPQNKVDYVVAIDSLGDPAQIVSTTTRVTTDPIGLQIAKYASTVIELSGLLKNGFSFQTGAGGTSLAVAANVRDLMRRQAITGSFGAGGITGYFVEMLEEGLLEALFDVQSFDLKAVASAGRNPAHIEMSADMYANPFNAGCVVNNLDCVVLGAREIDVDFNVNVNTESDGRLSGNTGGHADTAAGAKLSIVVAPSIRARLPIVRDEVTTISTPGATIDAVVTERGVALNSRYQALAPELARRGVPVKPIHQLRDEIYAITGIPRPIEFTDRVVGLIEYRDGSITDVIRQVAG
ncbi:citrate lyase subunit alpha [Halomonas sp. BM-2019]|uniref:citrate lyase subunit alpha n=1 Tax=Halomonas sp. BM-2019 TaxID=2811227 RepID=UPI001B3C3CDE|nr:MAG: citrate lyase subunit alpha [Halomonas sp. BM-2019]